ncbi:MAG: hypothetical protein EBT50_07530 [Verrucomicrobia bacterium]|nr:hypothetical protein [Verrucomicrobiota bacterium]
MHPRQSLPHLLFPKFLQKFAKKTHHPGEILFDTGKPPLEPFFVGQLGLTEFWPTPALFAVRGHTNLRC